MDIFKKFIRQGKKALLIREVGQKTLKRVVLLECGLCPWMTTRHLSSIGVNTFELVREKRARLAFPNKPGTDRN
jgi:hypothetical protein